MHKGEWGEAEHSGDSAERIGESVACIELHDIDRNLFRTERFSALIEEKFDAHGVDREHVRRIRQEVEESGGSFDTFSELRKWYSDEIVDAVKDAIFEEAKARADNDYEDEKCLFYPGARELIQQKPAEGTIRAFVTRGGQETQMLKLAIFGVDLDDEYYAIVPMEEKKTKAEMCVDSYDEESGKFLFKWLTQGRPHDGEVPKLVNIWADRVVVTDDKPGELLAIGALPKEKATGFLHRTGDGIYAQKMDGTELPENIFEICSLAEVGQFHTRVGKIALGSTQEWTQSNRLTGDGSSNES